MRKLNHGFFSQTIRKIHPVRITLLSILFLCAAAACNANGRNTAPVNSQTPAPAASAPAAPTAILMSTIAAVAPPPVSTGAPSASPPASSAATSPAAWKTYSSTLLQIALDYPPDWQIKEDASGVTFSSTQGSTIKLLQAPAGGLSPQADLPNTRCNQKINPSGLNARVCLDTISFSITADFSTGAADHSQQVALVMGKSGDRSVFDAMLQTLKVIP